MLSSTDVELKSHNWIHVVLSSTDVGNELKSHNWMSISDDAVDNNKDLEYVILDLKDAILYLNEMISVGLCGRKRRGWRRRNFD